MKDDKNQIIRSMKSYDEGGSSDSCGPGDGGRKRGKGCKSTTKYGRRSIPEPVKKIIGVAATGTAAILANKKYKLIDKAKEALGLKKGGAVKRKMQSGGSMFKPAPKRKMTVNTIPVKKSKYTTPPRKIQMAQSGGTASSTFADSERRMASPASGSAPMKRGGTIKRKK